VTDTVTLTLPHEEEFEPVAHLVLGGFAARLDLTVDQLEDLRLAIDGLLEQPSAGPLTVAVTADGNVLRTSVGPFSGALFHELEREDPRLGLRRVLEAVCDTYELEERNGGLWIELSKRKS
jgi:hypothetical protein